MNHPYIQLCRHNNRISIQLYRSLLLPLYRERSYSVSICKGRPLHTLKEQLKTPKPEISARSPVPKDNIQHTVRGIGIRRNIDIVAPLITICKGYEKGTAPDRKEHCRKNCR